MCHSLAAPRQSLPPAWLAPLYRCWSSQSYSSPSSWSYVASSLESTPREHSSTACADSTSILSSTAQAGVATILARHANFLNREQSPALPKGLLNWFGTYWGVSDTQVLNAASLDGFLFLRLLKVAVATCLVGCVICMPILFPVNATGPGGQKQLNLLSMANATSSDEEKSYFRWFAHAGCAWLFFGQSFLHINLHPEYKWKVIFHVHVD